MIVGGRVYVTTAVTAQRRVGARLACDYLVGCLAVLGIPVLVRFRWKSTATKIRMAGHSVMDRVTHALDLTLFVVICMAVFAFGALVAMGPNALDAGLNGLRDGGVLLARWLGRHQTNLWFLDWDEANRHNTWIISSAMALISLAMLPSMFPAHSMIRVVGAVALFGGVAVATLSVPWAVAYGSRFPTGALIVLYSPAAALGLWYVLHFFVNRFRAAEEVTAMAVRRTGAVGSVPALLALTVFVAPNYLYQREMVTRRVVCVDAATGRRVWQADVFNTPPEPKAAANSDATPTPIVAGDTIVATFGPAIAAVDSDGHLLWSKTIPGWVDNSIYGAGSSPVTDGGAVFLALDREYNARQQSRVIAYSLETGDEVWSQAPRFAHDGYSTPVMWNEGSRSLLLVLTSRALVGYARDDGALAWQVEIPVSQPIPSLLVDKDRVYVTGGIGSDGYTAAYQLQQGAPPTPLWTSNEKSDVSSPVLYRGRLFTISSTGVMVCHDAASGAVLWKHRIGSGTGAFYASLIAADDKIYAVKSNGTTYVVAVEDKFRLVSESSLNEDVFASPAMAGGCLFLRTVSALYCIANTTEESPVSGALISAERPTARS